MVKFVSWNVQGLRNKKSEVELEITKFDFVALVESWHSGDEVPSFRGFITEHVARSVSRNSRHYGGILVLLKNNSFLSFNKLKSESENLVWIK